MDRMRLALRMSESCPLISPPCVVPNTMQKDRQCKISMAARIFPIPCETPVVWKSKKHFIGNRLDDKVEFPQLCGLISEFAVDRPKIRRNPLETPPEQHVGEIWKEGESRKD